MNIRLFGPPTMPVIFYSIPQQCYTCDEIMGVNVPRYLVKEFGED